MSDVFRQAAAIMVLRPTVHGQGFEILLVRKPRRRDAWQLPQGGIEPGETLEQAAVRELREEAGLTDIELIGKSDTVYQYTFPASYRKFRPDNVCGQHIGFVLARMKGHQEVKVDGVEIHKFTWVKPRQLPRYLRRKQYLDIVYSLYREATKR